MRGAPKPRRCARFWPRFEQVVTSDLVRASETAALLGYPDATRDPRWREIDLGGWAGRPIAEFPDEQQGAWRGGPLHAADGESWARFVARVGGAVDALTAAGGDWLVVCHGGAIRAALTHITGADPRTVIGPAQHQRHRAAPALRRALRLDPRFVSDVTRALFSRKFSREGAFQKTQSLSSWGL